MGTTSYEGFLEHVRSNAFQKKAKHFDLCCSRGLDVLERQTSSLEEGIFVQFQLSINELISL